MTSRSWGSRLLVCALLPIGAAGCFSSSSSGGGTADASFENGSMPSFALLSGSSTNEAFGNVAVGSKSAASTVTITNTGQDASGTIATSVSGADSGAFVIESDGCNGKSLPSNGTCTIAAHFAPTKSGAANATLSVSATPGGSVDVALSGTGGSSGSIAFTASSQSFGTVGTGSMSASTTFTLTNGGGSPTGAITLTLGGADAAQFAKSNDGCSGKPLAPSGKCTVDVLFAPTKTGALSATLTASDPGGDMANVALSGTGASPAAFTVTPASHDFGSLTVGTTSSAQSFTVTNTGGLPSAVPSIGVTGTNASDFSVTSGCTAAVAPGKTCSFTAKFTPSVAMAEGPATATVSASGATSGSTALTGTGLAQAAISISPMSQPWGAYAWGTISSDVAFTVTNNGGTATGALAVSITGSDAGQFALGSGSTCSGAQLAASGGTCVVYAHFAPASPATGTVQASLTVAGTPGGTVPAALSGDAEPPASIAFGQGTYPLGPTPVGMPSSPVTLTIVNSGGVPSGIPGPPSITGPNASDFAVVMNNCTAAIAPMGTGCTMSVVFTPQTTSNEQATITVAASPGGTAQATLSGTGLTKPALAITPDPGNTFAATTVTKTSAPVTFTVTNSGQTATTALQAPSFAGGNSGDFSLLAGTDTCTGATLAASGGTCTIQVTVTPSVAGTVSTTLTVKDGSGDSATDPLSATGLSKPTLGLTPDPGNTFQTTVQGQTSSPVLFTLQNSGQTTSGVIKTPTFSNGYPGDFAVVSASDGCTGTTLAQNATCTFQVTFTPSTTTTETTTLSVSDASGDSTSDPLTATGMAGVAQLQISQTSYGFPATLANKGVATNPFTIKNVGTAATTGLTIQNVAAPFSQANNCPTSLGVGGSCSMTVTFAPTAPGPYSDTISIVDTASDTATLGLTGPGVNATYYLIVSPDPGAFGMVTGGTQKTLPFTVTNYGQTALPGPIASVAFTGNYGSLFSSNFANSNCSGVALTELQSCSLNITFSPPVGTGGGSVSGTAASFLSATGGPYVSDPLTGSW